MNRRSIVEIANDGIHAGVLETVRELIWDHHEQVDVKSTLPQLYSRHSDAYGIQSKKLYRIAEVIEMLVDSGASPNSHSPWNGMNPLELAVLHGHKYTVDVLLQYGTTSPRSLWLSAGIGNLEMLKS